MSKPMASSNIDTHAYSLRIDCFFVWLIGFAKHCRGVGVRTICSENEVENDSKTLQKTIPKKYFETFSGEFLGENLREFSREVLIEFSRDF